MKFKKIISTLAAVSVAASSLFSISTGAEAEPTAESTENTWEANFVYDSSSGTLSWDNYTEDFTELLTYGVYANNTRFTYGYSFNFTGTPTVPDTNLPRELAAYNYKNNNSLIGDLTITVGRIDTSTWLSCDVVSNDSYIYTYDGCDSSSIVSAPVNINKSDTAITWDAVDGAVGYLAKWTINGETKYESCSMTQSTEFIDDMENITEGKYTFEVCSIDINGDISDFSQYIYSLDPETDSGETGGTWSPNFVYDSASGKLSWDNYTDSSDGTLSYSVYANDTLFAYGFSFNFTGTPTVPDTNLPRELAAYNYKKSNSLTGDLTITVKSLDGSYVATDSFSYTYNGCDASTVVSAPTNINTNGTAVTWDAANGAVGYLAKWTVNDIETYNTCLSNDCSAFIEAMTNAPAGEYTFEVCSIDINGDISDFSQYTYTNAQTTENTFTYSENADGTLTITGGKIVNGDVVIPDTIDGKKVTEIGMYAFSSFDNSTANNIKTLVIPEGVKKLNWYAFNTCQNLTEVTLPQSLEYIDSWAFERCYLLKTINIPANVSVINGGAFAQNTSMTSIICDSANKNYVSVDGVLFTKDMTELVAYPGGISGAYTVPATVNHIGDAAFYGAKGITSVEILGMLDFIGFEAFAECELLTDVKINEGVTYVGYWAFRGCKGIKQLTVPQSVTNIGNQAFGFDSTMTKFSDFSLRGYTDSAIHYYAIRHEIPFISIGEVSEENSPFIDENETESEVSVNPNADKKDTIISIKVNPASNLKDKSDMGVGIDLTDIKVKANEIYDGEGLARAEAALGQEIVGKKHYNILDITLISGTTDISNKYDGLVKLLVPIPEGHRDKEFYCYRILDDGTKEIIPGKRELENYVIYLEHFSIYAFVAGEEHICSYDDEWETDENNHWHVCACGSIGDKENHTESDWIIDVEATANTEGSKHKKCTVCGFITETAVIPATGSEPEGTDTPTVTTATEPTITSTTTLATTTTSINSPSYTGRPSIVITTANITTTTVADTTTTTVTTTSSDEEDVNEIEEESDETEEEVEEESDEIEDDNTEKDNTKTEIDEDTDTTKPADKADSEESGDNNNSSSNVDSTTSDGADENPETGLAICFSGTLISVTAVALAKKKR